MLFVVVALDWFAAVLDVGNSLVSDMYSVDLGTSFCITTTDSTHELSYLNHEKLTLFMKTFTLI